MSKGKRLRVERAALDAGGLLLSAPSYSQKLNRAGKHVEDLRSVCDDWLGMDAYRIVPHTDAHTGRTEVRAEISKPPPPEVALIMGDAVHAIRASLDHLALELAVAFHSPSAVPSDIEENSEFVIVGDADETRGAHLFQSAAGRKLKGIDPKAREAIKGIQPYHRKTAFAQDPLWMIHELDRIDKHRRLNLTTYALGSVAINPPRGSTTMQIGELHIEHAGHDGPVNDGDVVAAYTIRNSNLQIDFTRDISLAEPSLPERVSVVEAVAALRIYVMDEVFPLLRQFL